MRRKRNTREREPTPRDQLPPYPRLVGSFAVHLKLDGTYEIYRVTPRLLADHANSETMSPSDMQEGRRSVLVADGLLLLVERGRMVPMTKAIPEDLILTIVDIPTAPRIPKRRDHRATQGEALNALDKLTHKLDSERKR